MRLYGESYLQFLRNQLPEVLEKIPLEVRRQMWFQHDGAPPRYTRIVRNYLDETFADTWIGRGGSINWPARSPDLNLLDFFLWGHVKGQVYSRDLPRDENDLRARINAAMATVTEDMLDSAVQSLIVRARKCIEVGAGAFEHLL